MFLNLFRKFADHPVWIGLSLALFLYGCHRMISLCGGTTSQIPDGQFGLTVDFFENMDDDVDTAYLLANTWDLCVVIPCYTLAFGGLGILAARRHNLNERFVLLALTASVADVVETCLFRYIVMQQPKSFWAVPIASIANQVKYSILIAILIIILGLLCSPSRTATGRASTKDE